jgi:hypothetical protein
LRARRITASTDGGMLASGARRLGGCGSSTICMATVAMKVWPLNGTLPVSISYMRMPREYTSTRASAF